MKSFELYLRGSRMFRTALKMLVMMPVVILTPGCVTTNFNGTKVDRQVDSEIVPEIEEVICDVLSGPIRYSKNDTEETINQIKVLHNSQWKEFNCGKR